MKNDSTTFYFYLPSSICPITSIVEFFFFSFPKSHHPLDGSDTRNEGLVWAARGMIRSRSDTIALCVAGKRRKIIDHGPVNMNGRLALLSYGEICKKETGYGGPHATQAFPISPDSLCSGFEVRGFQKRLNSAPRLAFDFIEGV